MTPSDTVEMRALAKSSRRAAALTAVGALILFSTLGYSAWKLAELDKLRREESTLLAKVETHRAEVEKLRQQLEKHREEDEGLQKQLEKLGALEKELQSRIQLLKGEVKAAERARGALQEERANLRASLQNIEGEVRKTDDRSLFNTVQKLTPLSAIVEPRAEAKPVPGGETPGGTQYYDFSIWLGLPSREAGRIGRVSYEFNHPTFTQPRASSTNPADGFRVSYRGWGCLNSVIIQIETTDGSTERIDFDMCKELRRLNRPIG